MKIGRVNALAALWGFAEAIVFFIVPDVFLSWLALDSFKRALIACLFAVLGAVVGGAALWLLVQYHPDQARSILESLPAISGAMIVGVHEALAESGLSALFIGPFTGVPYKIYIVEAANLNFGLAIFLAISIPARLSRFALVALVSSAASRLLRRRFSLRTVQLAHATLWLVFYAWFFWEMADK